jgi:hypothetical protein
VPAKYLYRAKYHSRLHSMPPVYVEPSVSIESLPTAPTTATTTLPAINHAFPPGPYYRRPHVDSPTIEPIAVTTTTTSTAAPRPWFTRPGSSNGTRPGGDTNRDNRWAGIRGGGRGRNATNSLAGHGGSGSGHWMTSSTTCTSHIVSVTLTQTVNVTVTATAAAWSTGVPMSYHTINGTLVPCPSSSSATASGTGTGTGGAYSHDHAWPWVWPRPPAPTTAERTQTVTLTLSHATLTRSRTHTVTITDAHGNLVAVPTACVIDPLLRPVVTGAGGHGHGHATTTFVPATATVCPKSAPSGAPPSKGSSYCGVRGRAAGEGSGRFLGRFEENAAGEEVTLEGCWMFCEVSVPWFGKASFYCANACCRGRRLEPATDAARMGSTASMLAGRTATCTAVRWHIPLMCWMVARIARGSTRSVGTRRMVSGMPVVPGVALALVSLLGTGLVTEISFGVSGGLGRGIGSELIMVMVRHAAVAPQDGLDFIVSKLSL